MKRNLSLLFYYIMMGWLCINTLHAQKLAKETNFARHRYLPCYGFKKMAHPEVFQGNRKKKKYFEGWYFKMVAKDGGSILSVIPGISLSQDGREQHAFIQIIDGKTAQTHYYSFPIEAFAFSRKEFAIKIEKNYFSRDSIILDIHSDSSVVSGKVTMSKQVTLPAKKILNSGIMGWYRFVPFMQCYHEVVSLTHQLEGSLVMDGKTYPFDQGCGYAEKDWGSSMPSAWIWMQSNSFSQRNSSFMLSVANIPWVGKSFTGFLGFFLQEGVLHRFATYTGAGLQIRKTGEDTLNITIRDRKNSYFITAIRNNSGLLHAPVKGSMDRRIPESIDARLWLKVLNRKEELIFCDSTSIAGLEIVGNQDILTGLLKKKR